MLTREQIKNWRDVLFRYIGPYVLFLPDSYIIDYVDKLQKFINDREEKNWLIKVRFKEKKDILWENIKPEEKVVVANFHNMKLKCLELLRKYPSIDAIQIWDGVSYQIFQLIDPEQELSSQIKYLIEEYD